MLIEGDEPQLFCFGVFLSVCHDVSYVSFYLVDCQQLSADKSERMDAFEKLRLLHGE